MRLTAGKKPMSAIRSASSTIAISTLRRSQHRRPIRSSSRPGQATRMSTPFSSRLMSRSMFVPPKTVMMERSLAAANGSSSSLIWVANSRVGDRITTAGCHGVPIELSSIAGIPNAKVLPEPVGALPQMSRPSIAARIVAVWIGKAVSMPALMSAETICSDTPSSANVVAGVSVVIPARPCSIRLTGYEFEEQTGMDRRPRRLYSSVLVRDEPKGGLPGFARLLEILGGAKSSSCIEIDLAQADLVRGDFDTFIVADELE